MSGSIPVPMRKQDTGPVMLYHQMSVCEWVEILIEQMDHAGYDWGNVIHPINTLSHHED